MNNENFEKLKELAKNKDDAFFDLLVAVGLTIVCTSIVDAISTKEKKGNEKND